MRRIVFDESEVGVSRWGMGGADKRGADVRREESAAHSEMTS
jgi:hypothetical protein